MESMEFINLKPNVNINIRKQAALANATAEITMKELHEYSIKIN